MLKKYNKTILISKYGKRANKNKKHFKKQTKKQTKKQCNLQYGGTVSYNQLLNNKNFRIEDNKEKFQVTTFRSINQDDLNRFKISNYVNNNIDWGIMPGPPPTDCIIQ